jgi:anti-repressor protein
VLGHEPTNPFLRNADDRQRGDEVNQLMNFNYEGAPVRIVMRDGEPWFVAKDVCEILGLEQVTRAMDRLDADEKGLLEVTHPQKTSETLQVNGVSEPGLYGLVLASRKPDDA